MTELSFSDHVSDLDALEGRRCRMEGFEAFHGFCDLLDETVILLDDVVQVFHLQDLDERPKAEEEQEQIEVQQAGLIGAALIDHLTLPRLGGRPGKVYQAALAILTNA